MAGGIWRDTSRQLPADVRFGVGELHVSTAHLQQGVRCQIAHRPRGVFAAAVPHIPANRMVLGNRLCSWSDLAADALGECRFVRLLVCVLLQHVLAASVGTLVIPFSSAGDGGNSPRIAKNADHGARRMRDGGDDNGADDLRVEQ